MEVFIITFVTSTISALAILVTGVWRSGPHEHRRRGGRLQPGRPGVGGWVVAFCAFLFGYTTLIGWSFYGEQCLEYLFGRADRAAVPLGLLRADRLRGDEQGRRSCGRGAT